MARAQAKATKEEENRKAEEAESLKEAQGKAQMATTPGQKRKRVPSPDTIPNPKRCRYGMDLDYFGCTSSDEDEEPGILSKQPNKVCYTSGPELKNAPKIPRSRVFAKTTREKKEENDRWPAPPATPGS